MPPTATPALPTELLQHILALALAAPAPPSPAARQQTRHAFALVCTQWFTAVPRWAELDVGGLGRAGRLAEAWRASAGRGIRVRACCLDLTGDERGKEGAEVGELLGMLSGLERLEVVVEGEVGDELAGWIARCGGLRHLTVRGEPGRLNRPKLTAEWLELSVALAFTVPFPGWCLSELTFSCRWFAPTGCSPTSRSSRRSL